MVTVRPVVFSRNSCVILLVPIAVDSAIGEITCCVYRSRLSKRAEALKAWKSKFSLSMSASIFLLHPEPLSPNL
jgi:hypothetical protein